MPWPWPAICPAAACATGCEPSRTRAKGPAAGTGKYHDQQGREDLPVPGYVINSVVDLPDLMR
jgi:hypothetical protein